MKDMISLSFLQDFFNGFSAVILGGGETLLEDVAKIPAGRQQLIAVNFHAFEVGIKPHFMVYLDDPRDRPQMMRVIEQEEVTKVCPAEIPFSDVVMDVPYWRGLNSGTTAAWLGLWMGCNPVYLCGFDLYTGSKPYCHNNWTPSQVPAKAADLMRPWVEEFNSVCPHPERLVALSGPLQGLFPS